MKLLNSLGMKNRKKLRSFFDIGRKSPAKEFKVSSDEEAYQIMLNAYNEFVMEQKRRIEERRLQAEDEDRNLRRERKVASRQIAKEEKKRSKEVPNTIVTFEVNMVHRIESSKCQTKRVTDIYSVSEDLTPPTPNLTFVGLLTENAVEN